MRFAKRSVADLGAVFDDSYASAASVQTTHSTIEFGALPEQLKALVNHSYGDDVTAGYIVDSVERLREPAQRVADMLKDLCGVGAPEGASDAPLPRAVRR